MIRHRCEACNAKLRSADSQVGETVLCPCCRTWSRVPPRSEAEGRRPPVWLLAPLGLAAAVGLGLLLYHLMQPAPLDPADRALTFGKEAFTFIESWDKEDRTYLLRGTFSLGDDAPTTTRPGAVFVVMMDEGATLGTQQFERGDIVLLTSKGDYRLAPPGLEVSVGGRETLVVPSNSKLFLGRGAVNPGTRTINQRLR